MKPNYSICLLLCLVISCKPRNQDLYFVDRSWTEYSLPNGWKIALPPSSTVKNMRGIDSEPGYIYVGKDKIFIKFDSGINRYKKRSCNVEINYQNASADIDTGFYKTFYHIPDQHHANIEKIAGRIAVVVTPSTMGKGNVHLSLKDCDSDSWIGLDSENLNQKNQQLVLKIFHTIDHYK